VQAVRMKNGGALRARINAVAQEAEDRAFVEDIRAWHPDAVAHLDDEELTAKVTLARERAISFGITDPRLRARFVMIGVVLAPEFWRQPQIYHLLVAPTGNADIRFGDACAAIRVAMIAAGRQAEIWWQ
jgi:hypothetical protein